MAKKKSVKADVKRTAKNVSKNTKAIEKAVKKILPKKAAKKVAKKSAPKKRINPAAKADEYELRDAPYVRGNTPLERLESLERNSDKFDALKRDDEVWAFTFYGYNSARTFRTAKQAIQKIYQYRATNLYGDSLDKEGEELIDGIKLMKLPETERTEYRNLKTQERAQRAEKRGGLLKTLSEMFGGTNKETKQKKTSTDYLGDLLARLQALEAENAKIMEALKGGNSKKSATKRTVKKSAKKVAKKAAKKSGKVQQARKSVSHGKKTAKKKAPQKSAPKKSVSSTGRVTYRVKGKFVSKPKKATKKATKKGSKRK